MIPLTSKRTGFSAALSSRRTNHEPHSAPRLRAISRAYFLTVMLALLSLLAIPRASKAGCSDGFTLESQETNAEGVYCMTFRIDACAQITSFQIIDPDSSQSSAGWFCVVTMDTQWNDGTTFLNDPFSHFKTGYWHEDFTGETPGHRNFKGNIGPPPGEIETGGQGWLTLCVCCGMGRTHLPFYIKTTHGNGTTTTSSLIDARLFSDVCPDSTAWSCWEHCDSISFTHSTSRDNRDILCLDVHHNTPGRLYHVEFDFDCTGKHTWKLLSMPAGWSNLLLNQSTAVFSGMNTAGIPNCGVAEFCFISNECTSGLCATETVSLHTWNDSLGTDVHGNDSIVCNNSVPAAPLYTNPTGCCEVAHQTPFTYGLVTQSPSTGIWTYCFTMHRSNNDPLTRIFINHCDTLSNSPRCWEVTSWPAGWDHVSSSGCTDEFDINGADTTGCRTLDFCFQTCDCHVAGGEYKNVFGVWSGVTGEFLPEWPTRELHTVSINPGDGGLCCSDGWHNYDYVTLEEVSVNCMKWKWHADDPADCGSGENSFSFTVPTGCSPSSPTGLPLGWMWSFDTTTHTMTVVQGPGSPLGCCGEMDITVCFDCNIGATTFTSDWSSSIGDNGSVTYTYPAPKIAAGGGSSTIAPANNGEPNFPNPFGSATGFKTTIPFETSQTGTASIRIVDQTGHEVLKDNMDATYAGKHFFYFTGDKLPAGTYYYQIEFPQGVVIVNRTMLLVKLIYRRMPFDFFIRAAFVFLIIPNREVP